MKKITSLFIVFIIIFAAPIAKAKEPVTIDSPSAILIEKNSGTVIFEKNADDKLKPASVTKIMTLILIMEAIDSGQISYDDIVTASKNATSMGGSQVYLKENEKMSVDEMLKCITVASANDACVAMAEFICGSVESFVTKMNEKASSLGMNSTNFENCTGLDSENHYTTARDIAKMSQELLKYDKIKEYTTIWTDSIRNGEFGLTNTNKLIRFYKYATGLKTGYTSESKYCISATAEKDKMELISVIMASESSSKRNEEAKKLLEYGFNNYTLYNENYTIENVKIDKGKNEYITPVVTDTNSFIIKKSDINSVEIKIEIDKVLQAPVYQEQKIGKIMYYIGQDLLYEKDIVSPVEVKKISLTDVFLKIVNYFLFL